MTRNPTPNVQALFERPENGLLSVSAILREDSYETHLGDGYCADIDSCS